MNGKYTLYLDQYGNRFSATTVKGLREQIGMGGCRVSKMYNTRSNGDNIHVGYVVGCHWLTAFQPVEKVEVW